MDNTYSDVVTRFLRADERLVLSDEKEMPLVIEADKSTDVNFLKKFLSANSAPVVNDIAKYGAVLLRGFDIATDEDFEQVVLSIQGFQGISDAFMSEEGRIHVDGLKYVLHTNAVYKTGGTLYLGGFHTENYYSADVPGYISFCCLKPSETGGETGIINTKKLYGDFNNALKEKLEKNTFFVCKWLVTEVAERYNLSTETVEKKCKEFDLPIVGNGNDKFVLMYKPSVFENPVTNEKSLQINLLEIPTLNLELSRCFINDYNGTTWFWHRFVWRLPSSVFNALAMIYMSFSSFFYSPKDSLKILFTKINVYRASTKKNNFPSFNDVKVGSCFSKDDISQLAKSMRKHYSSCLWRKGDILLVDNKQVMHAGMPGSGSRVVRAMICNPIEMKYSHIEPGYLTCRYRTTTIGERMKLHRSIGQ